MSALGTQLMLCIGVAPPRGLPCARYICVSSPREAFRVGFEQGVIVVAKYTDDPALRLLARHYASIVSVFVVVADSTRPTRIIDYADYVIPTEQFPRVVPHLIRRAGSRRRATSRVQHSREGFDLRAAQRRAVRDALIASDGNVAAAARILGISRPALYRLRQRLDK